ncbi:hypothetical protein FH972_018099 [Carpinus fangiana]|uniref:Uncharacterized protein n=1 Tax=Carpinus fangiana TaxID=176857 RepID=A0A5N6RL55_9ROSI|nr:hypothetical protein FH972_018099 [Carpinus fangiana]
MRAGAPQKVVSWFGSFNLVRECLLHTFGENQVPKIMSHRQHQAGVFPRIMGTSLVEEERGG